MDSARRSSRSDPPRPADAGAAGPAGPGATRRAGRGAPRRAAPGPARSTSARRREQVLDAAVVEFARTGLHGTSTESIARRVGVSQPYLFRLFGTKRALFCAAVERAFERVMAVFEVAAEDARAQGLHPFHVMGTRYLELLADRDQIRLQMQSQVACDDPAVRALVQQQFGRLYQWLEALEPDPERVHGFLSTGMLLNVAAAIDLPSLVEGRPWAARCLDVPMQRVGRAAAAGAAPPGGPPCGTRDAPSGGEPGGAADAHSGGRPGAGEAP